MNKAMKWTPVQLMKKPDNIISSKAREVQNYGFKPSYMSEKTEHMNYIMSNEYMRIWFKERGKFEIDTYSKEEIIKEESKIKRRGIQRMMTYKKPTKNKFIDEYAERKLLKNKEETVDYSKYKYKPSCAKHRPTPERKSSSKSEERITKDAHQKSGKSKNSGQMKHGDRNENVCDVESISVRSSKCS